MNLSLAACETAGNRKRKLECINEVSNIDFFEVYNKINYFLKKSLEDV